MVHWRARVESTPISWALGALNETRWLLIRSSGDDAPATLALVDKLSACCPAMFLRLIHGEDNGLLSLADQDPDRFHPDPQPIFA